MSLSERAAELAAKRFPKRRISYSNEDFDVMQSIASTLTDEDRKAGKEAPKFGYSSENYEAAKVAVNARLSPW